MIWWILFTFGIATADVSDREIMNSVLDSFPGVKVAQQEVKIAEGKNLSALGAFDLYIEGSGRRVSGDYNYDYVEARLVKPTAIFGLDLYGGFRRSDDGVPPYYGELETLSRGEWSVGAKLPLLRGFWIDERRAQLQQSELALETQKLQLRSVELQQIKTSLHQYWEWRLALKRSSIYKTLLDAALLRDKWLEKRTKHGDLAHFERQDNRRSILQRQSAFLQAEQLLKEALFELQYFVEGDPLENRLRSASSTHYSFAVPDNLLPSKESLEALSQRAMANRPDLLVIGYQRQQFEVEKSLASNRFLPRLDLQAQHSKDRGVGSTTLDDDNTQLSLNLEIPLQYRRIRGGYDQAEASLLQLESKRKLLEQRIQADLGTVQNKLEIALQRRDLAREELDLAHKLEAGERRRLFEGASNILTVNLREIATAEAELRYAESSIEAMKHTITLKTTIGELPL